VQLDEAGVSLRPSDSVFVDSRVGNPPLCDRLESKLWRDPARFNSVIASIDSLLTSEELLRSILVPIELCIEGLPRGNTMAHELLSTPSLQAKVATYLAELVPNTENSSTGGLVSAYSILSQFRWVEVLKDPDGVVNALLEVQELCSFDIRCQIMSFVPELAGPAQHQAVVNTCTTMLRDNPAFAPAVLECLDGLDLSHSLRSTAISSVVGRLSQMSKPQAAQACRLLLQGVPSDDEAKHVVSAFRSAFSQGASSEPMKGKAITAASAYDGGDELVESLATSLHLNQRCRKAYVALLKELTEASQLVPVDCWAIFVLAEAGGPSKSASKEAQGLAKRHLPTLQQETPYECAEQLRRALQKHWRSIGKHRQGILRTAGWLASSSAHNEALQVYNEAFERSNSSGEREEVLGELATHALSASGGEPEAVAACKALQHLAQHDAENVDEHRSTIVSLLDASETLAPSLQEPLMSAFASLAVHELQCCAQNQPVLSDMQRLMHKGLPSPTIERRCAAVTASVALLERLSLASSSLDESKGTKVASSILKLLKTHCFERQNSARLGAMSSSGIEAALADHVAHIIENNGRSMSFWARSLLFETFVDRLEGAGVLESPQSDSQMQEVHRQGWKVLANFSDRDHACEIEVLLDPRSGGLGCASAPLQRLAIAIAESKPGGSRVTDVAALLLCPLRLAHSCILPMSQLAKLSEGSNKRKRAKKTKGKRKQQRRDPATKSKTKKEARVRGEGEYEEGDEGHDEANAEDEDDAATRDEDENDENAVPENAETESEDVHDENEIRVDMPAHARWALSIFYASDWIRESISCFAEPAESGRLAVSDEDDSMRANSKLLQRLRQLAQLEALLDSSSPAPYRFPNQSSSSTGIQSSNDWRLCARSLRIPALNLISSAAKQQRLIDCLSAVAPILRSAAAMSDARLQQLQPHHRHDPGISKLLYVLRQKTRSIFGILSRCSNYLALRADEEQMQNDENSDEEQHQSDGSTRKPPGSEDLAEVSETASKACTNLTLLAARSRALCLRILRRLMPPEQQQSEQRARSSAESSPEARLNSLRSVCDNMLSGGAFDPVSAADAVTAMEAIAANSSDEHREMVSEAACAFLSNTPGVETQAPLIVPPSRAQQPSKQDLQAERINPDTGQPSNRRIGRSELGRSLRQLIAASVRNAGGALKRLHCICTEQMSQVEIGGNDEMLSLKPETAAFFSAELHFLLQEELRTLAGDASVVLTGSSISGPVGSNQQHPEQLQQVPLPPKSTLNSLMRRAAMCASAFRGLNSAAHPLRNRTDVLISTLRDGRKTLAAFMSIFPLLETETRSSSSEGAPMVVEVTDDVQKAMRSMQRVIEEARSRRDTSLLSCVPPAKRSLETYLLRVEGLSKKARSNGLDVGLTVGTLKHRNLAGNLLPSQLGAEEADSQDAIENGSVNERAGKQSQSNRRGKENQRQQQQSEDHPRQSEAAVIQADGNKEEGENVEKRHEEVDGHREDSDEESEDNV